MKLNTLAHTLSAKQSAKLEGIDERTERKCIRSNQHPFGYVIGTQCRVATIPLLEKLGITEEEALEIIGETK